MLGAGRIRALAITNPTRVAYLPDIPTISEHVPGCVSHGWFGFIASRPCLRHRRFPEQGDQRRVSFPDVREKMTLAGLEVVQQPPEYFGDVIRQDYAKYGQLARDIGFKPQ